MEEAAFFEFTQVPRGRSLRYTCEALQVAVVNTPMCLHMQYSLYLAIIEAHPAKAFFGIRVLTEYHREPISRLFERRLRQTMVTAGLREPRRASAPALYESCKVEGLRQQWIALDGSMTGLLEFVKCDALGKATGIGDYDLIVIDPNLDVAERQIVPEIPIKKYDI